MGDPGTVSSAGATSTAAIASSRTATPSRTLSGCHPRRRIAYWQLRDLLCPARSGRTPAAARPRPNRWAAGKPGQWGSSGRGDRSSQAPGPGRAVQQERRGARSGREPVGPVVLGPCLPTGPPGSPTGSDAHLPGRPTPARMPTDRRPGPAFRPHYPPARLPTSPAHLRARLTYCPAPPGSPPIGPMPTGPTR